MFRDQCCFSFVSRIETCITQVEEDWEFCYMSPVVIRFEIFTGKTKKKSEPFLWLEFCSLKLIFNTILLYLLQYLNVIYILCHVIVTQNTLYYCCMVSNDETCDDLQNQCVYTVAIVSSMGMHVLSV